MGTHLRALVESYPMDTKMTGFRFFALNLTQPDIQATVGSVFESHTQGEGGGEYSRGSEINQHSLRPVS